MGKLYLLDIGFVEPTRLYELRPVEVGSLKEATVDEVARWLEAQGIKHVVIDAAYPTVIDALKPGIVVTKLLRAAPDG